MIFFSGLPSQILKKNSEKEDKTTVIRAKMANIDFEDDFVWQYRIPDFDSLSLG